MSTIDHTEPFLGTRLQLVVNFQYRTISGNVPQSVPFSELLLIYVFHHNQKGAGGGELGSS